MQRAQPAEGGPGQIEIQRREGELEGDDDADQEAGDAPHHRGDGGELHWAEIIVRPAVDLERRQRRRAIDIAVQHHEHRDDAGQRREIGVEGIARSVAPAATTSAPSASRANSKASPASPNVRCLPVVMQADLGDGSVFIVFSGGAASRACGGNLREAVPALIDFDQWCSSPANLTQRNEGARKNRLREL